MKMKRVLILSYYYFPCNGVAAYRPNSWYKYFPKNNIYPIVLTRHWNGNENKWPDYLVEKTEPEKFLRHENGATCYMPYYTNLIVKFTRHHVVQKLGISKLFHLILPLLGKFQLEVDAYNCLKKKAIELIKTEKIDAIIATSPPLNIINLAYKLGSKYNIPYIIDFRDSWNNLQLIDDFKPTIKDLYFNKTKEFYLKKWLSNSKKVITVTPIISELLLKNIGIQSDVVTNGYEKDLLTSLYAEPNKQKFIVSVIGTIHEMQNIQVLLNGLKLFLKNNGDERIEIAFYGVESFDSVTRLIKEALPLNRVITTPRISRNEAIAKMFDSSVLLFPSYHKYRDYYTAKIFEYLGSKRNILMVPANNDKVDELIKDSGSGKIAVSEKDVAFILNKWFEEFKAFGKLNYNGNEEYINKFSRESLAGKLAELAFS